MLTRPTRNTPVRTVLGLLVTNGLLVTILCVASAQADDPGERLMSLVSGERYAEARETLESMLERNPETARLRLIDGILRAREGKTVEAISVFEALRGEQSDMFEAYNNLAVLYAREGKLDAGRDVLIAALERWPNATAYANLGDIYMKLAERAYARARDVSAGMGAVGSAEAAHAQLPRPVALASPAADEDPAHTEAVSLMGQAPVAVPRPKPLVSAASKGACLHAGKFKDRAAAAESAEWLQERGAQVLEIRHEQRHEVKNYLVYLPEVPSAKAAAAKLSELRGRGVHDVAVISKGAMAGQISLGLYESGNNARRRVSELRKLGYPAKSVANIKALSEYAVAARTPGARSDLDVAWKAKFPKNPVRDIVCP